jgi:hypothetical protein
MTTISIIFVYFISFFSPESSKTRRYQFLVQFIDLVQFKIFINLNFIPILLVFGKTEFMRLCRFFEPFWAKSRGESGGKSG